jgi:anaerobic selenocysteine-containing dehydrogenase
VAQAVVEVEKIASMCGICDAGCGVHVHMREGRIERLTPIKEHPLGIVCPRGGDRLLTGPSALSAETHWRAR